MLSTSILIILFYKRKKEIFAKAIGRQNYYTWRASIFFFKSHEYVLIRCRDAIDYTVFGFCDQVRPNLKCTARRVRETDEIQFAESASPNHR